jgi:hypothetical protein
MEPTIEFLTMGHRGPQGGEGATKMDKHPMERDAEMRRVIGA